MYICFTKIYDIERKESSDLLTFAVPKDASEGYINNKKEEYRFRYFAVFFVFAFIHIQVGISKCLFLKDLNKYLTKRHFKMTYLN